MLKLYCGLNRAARALGLPLAAAFVACAMAAEEKRDENGGTLEEAMVLHEHAMVYVMNREMDRAEAMHRRALSIRETLLGPNHVDVAISLNFIGYLLCTRRRFEEAEVLYRRSLQIREEQLGPDHSRIVTALRNLAQLLPLLDKAAEADEITARSRAMVARLDAAEAAAAPSPAALPEAAPPPAAAAAAASGPRPAPSPAPHEATPPLPALPRLVD